jgi:hypothetical protein
VSENTWGIFLAESAQAELKVDEGKPLVAALPVPPTMRAAPLKATSARSADSRSPARAGAAVTAVV